MKQHAGVADAARRMIVLVVEDEFLVRMATADHLRVKGFDVVEARNADDAVRILGTTPVDAVFADITMPGRMDGMALAKWVQQHKPVTKVILTSGAPSRVDSVEFGPLVVKPYLYSEVVARLQADLQATATPYAS